MQHGPKSAQSNTPFTYKKLETVLLKLTHVVGKSWVETDRGEEANLLYSAYKNIEQARNTVAKAKAIAKEGRHLHPILCPCDSLPALATTKASKAAFTATVAEEVVEASG